MKGKGYILIQFLAEVTPLPQSCIPWGARQELATHSICTKGSEPTNLGMQQGWELEPQHLEAGTCGRQCLLPSHLPSVRASIGQHGCVLSWRGTPERLLTSGIKKHLISCAFLLSLTRWNLKILELLKFLDVLFFFFLFNFHLCVRLCLGSNQIWKCVK